MASTTEKSYPTDYFRSPVKHKLRLSGTFGELRSNHFHSGIDIKSVAGAVGDDILAAADGYISRINVKPTGYGKAIYLTHDNGYTTVYGHLHRFHSDLEAYIKELQYEKESFSIDNFPEKGRFAFRKGQKIGVMGNTGGSGGPHLHFEIRDSKTEKPINPLLFGLKVADTQTPRMNQLRVYELDNDLSTIKHKSFDLIRSNATYHSIRGGKVIVNTPKVGVALKTYDRMNNVTNWNGVYAIESYQDDTMLYKMQMEKFAFDEWRYINAHIDYKDRVTRRSFYNRCYLLPGNKAPVYEYVRNRGIIQLDTNQVSEVVVISKDFRGNESRVKLQVQYIPKPIKKKTMPYTYILPYDEESIIDNGQIYLYFPDDSFYEDVYLDYRMTADESANAYSQVHHIADYTIPVHNYFEIAIRPTNIDAALTDKYFVGLCRSNGRVTNMGGYWKDERLWTKTRAFGNYCIMLDTIPPTVRRSSFRNDMRGRKTMSFKINDNIGAGGSAKGLSYEALVDDKWVLFEYDAKNDLISHRFDGSIERGRHELWLKVSDSVGNATIVEETFVR